MPFKKGQSGNPKGRRVEGNSKELWKAAGIKGRELIERVISDATIDMKIRVDASKYASDQAFGKAAQSVEMSGKDGEALSVSVNIIKAEK